MCTVARCSVRQDRVVAVAKPVPLAFKYCHAVLGDRKSQGTSMHFCVVL